MLLFSNYIFNGPHYILPTWYFCSRFQYPVHYLHSKGEFLTQKILSEFIFFQSMFSEAFCSCWWSRRFGKNNFNSGLQLYRLDSFIFHSLCFIRFWRLGSSYVSPTSTTPHGPCDTWPHSPTILGQNRPLASMISNIWSLIILCLDLYSLRLFRTLNKGRRLIGLDEYPKLNFTNMTTTVSFELPTSPSTISVTTIRKFLLTFFVDTFCWHFLWQTDNRQKCDFFHFFQIQMRMEWSCLTISRGLVHLVPVLNQLSIYNK